VTALLPTPEGAIQRIRTIDQVLDYCGVEEAAANARLIAAAPELLEALKPFAAVAQHDIGDDEADRDLFRPIGHNHAPLLTVGHLRAALAAVAKAGAA
jgi:hypothetical protein